MVLVLEKCDARPAGLHAQAVVKGLTIKGQNFKECSNVLTAGIIKIQTTFRHVLFRRLLATRKRISSPPINLLFLVDLTE
jgi:hypothetical protein